MAHRDTDISRANGSQEIFSLIPVTSEAHHVTLLNVGKDLVETLTRNGGRVLAFRFDKLQGCRGFVFGSDRDKHVVQLDKNSGKGCLNLKHFQIDVQWEDGKLYVYDLGSSLGTHVRTKKNCSFVNAGKFSLSLQTFLKGFLMLINLGIRQRLELLSNQERKYKLGL